MTESPERRMGRRIFPGRILLSDFAVLIYLSLFKLVLHLLTNGNYGYFRDELYYIACGEHLDWGYVDQPPLIAFVAKAVRVVLGDSLPALRLLPALAGASLVFVTGLIVRRLNGSRFAIILACLAVSIAPVYLIFHTLLTMNAFEPLLWMLCAYIAILILQGADQRLWLVFGAVAGVGLMNKHSMFFWGSSFVIALLLTPSRKLLKSKWPWLGGLVALLIFLPNIIWEYRHGWVTLEVLENASRHQNLEISSLDFIKGQILLLHPATLPVWVGGLAYYLFSKRGKQFRLLGLTYLALLAVFIALKGKVYYLAPAYPMLLAAGAVAFERLFRRRGGAWLRASALLVLAITGIVTAPLALPVLPVETFIRYSEALGLQGVRTEQNRWGELPQHYADMFGWEDLTTTVAQVYGRLSPEEQAKSAIFADNYGEAGAIDFFGPKYGLPKAISGHQNYYLWGPGPYTGEILITVGSDLEDLQPLFEEVEPAATFTNKYVMPYENNSMIYICKRMKIPLREFWPKVKCYSC
jgi:hypothetical protein